MVKGLQPRAQNIAKSLLGAISDPTTEQFASDPAYMAQMNRAQFGDRPIALQSPALQSPEMMGIPRPNPEVAEMLREKMQAAPLGLLGANLPDAIASRREFRQQQQEPEKKGFLSGLKNFVSDPAAMAQMAIAFNSMRLNPDQGLAQSMQNVIERQGTNKTQTEIIKWLQANGYEKYVGVAMENPQAAMEIFKQITQKEMDPGAATSVSGVQYDENNNAYVVKNVDGEAVVEYLGTERADPFEAQFKTAQMKLSMERADEVAIKANNVEEMLVSYQQALSALGEGAETGVIRSKLPALNAQTAALRSIASQLGIQVINSATFGALSEKELELALRTPLDLSLKPEALRKQIIAMMEATQKLYLEMRKKAAQLASMPYNEYIQLQNQIAQENEKYLAVPNEVNPETWFSSTLDEKKAWYEAGEKK